MATLAIGGHALQKVLEFRGYEIASETILGPKLRFLEARRQDFTDKYLPFLSTGLGFPIIRYKPCVQATAFTGKACEAIRLIVRLEERKVIGRKRFLRTAHGHLASFNMRCVRGGFASASTE